MMISLRGLALLWKVLGGIVILVILKNLLKFKNSPKIFTRKLIDSLDFLNFFLLLLYLFITFLYFFLGSFNFVCFLWHGEETFFTHFLVVSSEIIYSIEA